MGLNEKGTRQIANNGLSESGDISANSSQIKALTNAIVIDGLVDSSILEEREGEYYSTDNGIVESKHITSQEAIQGQDVTYYNCRFTGGDLYQVRNNNGKTGTNFVHCEFDLGNLENPSAFNQEMTDMKMYNCLIKNIKGGDGIKPIDGNEFYGVTMKDFTYVEGAHTDAIQIERGSNIVLDSIKIYADDTINNCLRINTGQGIVGNVNVSNCYFNGGGWCMNIRDNGSNALTGITLRDNVIGPDNEFGAYTTTTTAVGSEVPDVDSSNIYEVTRRPIV